MSSGSWSGREDSNLRPTVPKTVALPGCATPRTWCYLAGEPSREKRKPSHRRERCRPVPPRAGQRAASAAVLAPALRSRAEASLPVLYTERRAVRSRAFPSACGGFVPSGPRPSLMLLSCSNIPGGTPVPPHRGVGQASGGSAPRGADIDRLVFLQRGRGAIVRANSNTAALWNHLARARRLSP